MTVKEVYDVCGGNYQEAIQRFATDERLKKYLLMFIKDSCYWDLKNAVIAEDYTTAFHAVHSMKGIALNLNLDNLARSAAELCEAVRNEPDIANIPRLLYAVDRDYTSCYNAISKSAEE